MAVVLSALLATMASGNGHVEAGLGERLPGLLQRAQPRTERLRDALNNVQGTSVLGGPIVDLDRGETVVSLEAERRLGERWVGAFEMGLSG